MQLDEKFIGLIGLGYWGKNIFRNLYEIGVLHSVCDSEEDVISDYRKKYAEVSYTTSREEILCDAGITAVVVATPAVTHYEIAKQSLLAGKDVFVEKPLAITVKQGEGLVKLAENTNKILMVGHILQYHPAIIKLKELISSGELGKIQYIYSNRLNIGKLRTEENILWSFAPHDISAILMLLEEEPVKVTASGGNYLSNDIYDITITILEFKNGIKGHIFVSWLHPYKEQKLIVVGSKAMAVFDDVSNEKLFLYPHKIMWKDGKIPVAQKADGQTVFFDKKEPLREELKHFVDCVQRRWIPKTSGIEGLKVLKILEEAEKCLNVSSFDNAVPCVSSHTPNFYVHDSAVVDEDVKMGEGTKIWHFSHILRGSRIGKNCVIGQNVMIGPDVEIGNGCKIQNNVSIFKGVKLEDEVFCGPSCVFTNIYNPRAFIERKQEFVSTHVKRGATIGANATVVCGVTIGQYAMVGAGAVVKSDISDHAVVAGVPAKQIGWACKCGTTLKFHDKNSVCKCCGSKYILNEKGLISQDNCEMNDAVKLR